MNAVHALGSLWSLYLCCSGCWKCQVYSFQAAQDEEGARDFSISFALKFHQREQCISITSDISKWPRKIRLRAPGALTSDSMAAQKWAAKVRVPPCAPLLACPTEVMDKPGRCMFLNDKLNLPLVIAWNITSGVWDKLSSCAATCASPDDPGGEGCFAWVYQILVRQRSQIQHAFSFLFLFFFVFFFK